MPVFLLQYLSVLVIFLALDGIWLGIVARRFYVDQLGPLMREPVNWPVALGFYAIYAAGIVVLALTRAGDGGWTAAFAYGALLGLIAYGTYDLTNLATIKGFPPAMAMVDLAWGTLLTGIAAAGGLVVSRALAG